MKKVIVTEDIVRILKKEQSFLDRTGFMLLPAGSNEDVLSVHKKKRRISSWQALTQPRASRGNPLFHHT